MIVFTKDGIKLDTFEEIFDRKVAEYKAIYGVDIDLSQDTPDGQRIGIEANTILDLQSFIGWLYTQVDPDFSQGEMLNVLCKICGITRKPGTRSTCDVVINANRDLTLPDGWAAKDLQGNLWVVTQDTNLSEGDNTITLFAKYFGAVSAQPGDINAANDIVLGVVSILNSEAATVGVDEETDEELRIRRNRSTANPSYSTIGDLHSALFNLVGVKDVRIYENKTRSHDARLDMAANSIWVVVDGGSVDAISHAITISKTLGCGEKGRVVGRHIEQLPSGQTITHEPLFDRPRRTDVTLQLIVRSKTSSTVDVELIRAALLEVKFSIGENIDLTELYSNIYAAHPSIVATGLTASTDNISVHYDTLAADSDQILVLNTINITVL